MKIIRIAIDGSYEICHFLIETALSFPSIEKQMEEKDKKALKKFLSDAVYHRISDYNPFIKLVEIKASVKTVKALVNLARAIENRNWDELENEPVYNHEIYVVIEASKNNPDLPKEMDPFITPITCLAHKLCKELNADMSIVPPYDSFRNRKTTNNS